MLIRKCDRCGVESPPATGVPGSVRIDVDGIGPALCRFDIVRPTGERDFDLCPQCAWGILGGGLARWVKAGMGYAAIATDEDSSPPPAAETTERAGSATPPVDLLDWQRSLLGQVEGD